MGEAFLRGPLRLKSCAGWATLSQEGPGENLLLGSFRLLQSRGGGGAFIKVRVTGNDSACEQPKVRKELRSLDASFSSLDTRVTLRDDASGKHFYNPGYSAYSIYGALISKPRV